MHKRNLFLVIFSVIIIAVILVLGAAGSLPQRSVTPPNSSSNQVASAEYTRVQVDALTLISDTPEPLVTQAKAPNDGPAILKRHCTQCHPAQSLDQIVKSHAEWEKTLAQMEALGLRLEDPEKVVLLDYFAAKHKP